MSVIEHIYLKFEIWTLQSFEQPAHRDVAAHLQQGNVEGTVKFATFD
jgi:hypothetical protein